MAFILKILGMIMLVIGFAVTFMVTCAMFVHYFVAAVANGEVAKNPSISTLTAPIAFLSCSVPLVMGTIMYVGGHALSYMDARKASERRASQYQDKERTQERVDRNRAKSRSSGPLD